MPGMEREEMQEEPATRLESERYKVLSTSFQVMLEHQDRNRTAVETILARLSGLDRSSPLADPAQPPGPDRLFHFSEDKSCTPSTQTDHHLHLLNTYSCSRKSMWRKKRPFLMTILQQVPN